MKAAVVESENTITVKDIPVPSLIPGHAIVKVAYSGLCGPTDEVIINGTHPRKKYPLVVGHEFSGVIEQIDSESTGFKAGDPVVINPLLYCGVCPTCRQGDYHVCRELNLIGIDRNGGYEEYCLVPVGNLRHIPAGLPLNVAALAEPMAVAVHAVRGLGMQVGRTALVFGAGPIGLLVTEVCRLAGGHGVALTDINIKRLGFAETLGFKTIADIDEDTAKYDFVFDTTGAPAVLPQVIERIKIKGKVGIVGKFDRPALLDLHEVLFNELVFEGFRVYRDDDFDEAISILAANPERYEKFISDYFTLDDFQQMYQSYLDKNNIARIMVRI